MDENVNTTSTQEEEVNNEEKKEVNFFRRVLRAMKTKIASVFGAVKNMFSKKSSNSDENTTESSDENSEEKKPGWVKRQFTRFKNWVKADPDFSGSQTVRDLGFGGSVAYRSASFIEKLKKKIFKRKEEKDPSKLAKVILRVMKVLCGIAAVGFAGVVLVYAVKLLPAIICTVAECLAVALIVELIFTVLQTATGVKTSV